MKKKTTTKEQYGDDLLELHAAHNIWDVLCCCQKTTVFWGPLSHPYLWDFIERDSI